MDAKQNGILDAAYLSTVGMKWTIIAVLALIGPAFGQEICLSADEDPYLQFGTKTAYIFANTAIPNLRVHDVPSCTPTAVWLLSRHGAFNPKADEDGPLQYLADFKNNVINNYKKGNFRNTGQRICSADVKLLEQWKWTSSGNSAGDLTSEGYMTTEQQAQAWKQKFPGVLMNNSHNYLFKYVKDQVSMTSFKAFTEGIFKDKAEALDIPKENDEKLLRPHKHCPAWINNVQDNNVTLEQLRIFESKQEYKDMISNISLRLGFNYDIQKDLVKNIYQMCRYNKASNVAHISPWCAVFNKEDLKRLEYAEDLETYYKYGYGSELNQKVGCTMVQDMVKFLKKHADKDVPVQPKSQIQFTDEASFLLTLTAMRSQHDTAPLTGDNFHTRSMDTRKWRTSSVAPFNANLAAVLYKCDVNGKFQINERHQVLFLQNEKPMNIEGCKLGLCDWTFVSKQFGDVADKCDLGFCNSGHRYQGFVSVCLLVAISLKFLF